MNNIQFDFYIKVFLIRYRRTSLFVYFSLYWDTSIENMKIDFVY